MNDSFLFLLRVELWRKTPKINKQMTHCIMFKTRNIVMKLKIYFLCRQRFAASSLFEVKQQKTWMLSHKRCGAHQCTQAWNVLQVQTRFRSRADAIFQQVVDKNVRLFIVKWTSTPKMKETTKAWKVWNRKLCNYDSKKKFIVRNKVGCIYDNFLRLMRDWHLNHLGETSEASKAAA